MNATTIDTYSGVMPKIDFLTLCFDNILNDGAILI